MRKKFLTRLAARALVVAVAGGTWLLGGGVVNAEPPAGYLGTVTTSIATSTLAATATTTTLTAAPSGSFPEGLPVALIAIVTPPGVEGTVQFKEGDTNIDDPRTVLKSTSCSFGSDQRRTVIDGASCPPGSNEEITAAAFTLTPTLTAGTHSLTAEFTPTDPSAFDSSASPPVSFTVTPPITTELPRLIDSILRPIFAGLPGGMPDPDPVPVVPPIFGGLHVGRGDFDPAKFIPPIFGGLHF
ncbi:MAG: Ig-like domain-containing protein [Pseudonocardiaceae bacterium]